MAFIPKIKTKTQRYRFAHEALPILFHTQAPQSLDYMRQDALKFLRFWWKHVALDMKLKEIPAPEGLACKIYDLENGATLVLVTVPAPLESSEAYFVALYNCPRKGFLFIRSALNRVITLEKLVKKDGSEGTLIGEWTPAHRHNVIGPGPEPELQAFHARVMEILTSAPESDWKVLIKSLRDRIANRSYLG